MDGAPFSYRYCKRLTCENGIRSGNPRDSELNEVFHVDSGGAVAGVIVIGSTVVAVAGAFVELNRRGIFYVDVKPYLDGTFCIG
jgi:hypothetical protein